MGAVETVIDEELVAAFRDDGFAALPRLVDDAELGWLRGVYDRLFSEHADFATGDYFDIAARQDSDGPARLPQIVRPEKFAPELVESEHFKRCRAIAARLLDVPEDELDFYGHAILKPPNYGAETPWHQDEGYMDPRWHRRGLSVWTTLDEATVESGCLHYLPGGHLGPVLPHRHIDDDDRIRGLVTDAVDPAAGVAVPLAAGEAVVHTLRAPHYAGPNRTGQTRRAYVLVFMGPVEEVADPEPRPWLDAR
ncbi:phytanoyl-CoA dioxygenase family protein [Streptomyces sp. NPDC021100]|uniref:phytanoyl-CoA dioxygenase family protein n=1 Tax=Streptomyces sp. NPDC021100 TaxID=3365114 RepID=UPI00378E3137